MDTHKWIYDACKKITDCYPKDDGFPKGLWKIIRKTLEPTKQAKDALRKLGITLWGKPVIISNAVDGILIFDKGDNMKYKRTYRLKTTENGIERISFKNLRAGDVFYSENDKGSLEVGPSGKFITVALCDPEKVPPKGNYGIMVEYLA